MEMLTLVWIAYIYVASTSGETVIPNSYLTSFTRQAVREKVISYNYGFTDTLEHCAKECAQSSHLRCTAFVFVCGRDSCSGSDVGDCLFINDLIASRNNRRLKSVGIVTKYIFSSKAWMCSRYESIEMRKRLRTIVSPSYPRIVGGKTTCNTTISAASGYYIQLTIHNWLLSQHGCLARKGGLKIYYDYINKTSGRGERLCPNRVPYTIRSPGNKLTITMNNMGPIVFKATYQFVRKSECVFFQCEHGGTCMAAGGELFCLCPNTYTGRFCEVDVAACEEKHCENNSSCATLSNKTTVCICNGDFQGERCNRRRFYSCDNSHCVHGVCRLMLSATQVRRLSFENLQRRLGDMYTHTCECDSGYTGRNCDTKLDTCIKDPCRPGRCVEEQYTYVCVCSLCHYGFCISGESEYYCMCFPGYTGEHCTINIDECSSSPCGEHGRCVDFVNAYRCICEHDYIGEHCDIYVADNQSQVNLHRTFYTKSVEQLQMTTQQWMTQSTTSAINGHSNPPTSHSTSALHSYLIHVFTTQPTYLQSVTNYYLERRSTLPPSQTASSGMPSFFFCLNETIMDRICFCEDIICKVSHIAQVSHFCAHSCAHALFDSCKKGATYCIKDECMEWWTNLSYLYRKFDKYCAKEIESHNKNRPYEMINKSASFKEFMIPGKGSVPCVKHSISKPLTVSDLSELRKKCSYTAIEQDLLYSCSINMSSFFPNITHLDLCETNKSVLCLESVPPYNYLDNNNILISNISFLDKSEHRFSKIDLKFEVCMKALDKDTDRSRELFCGQGTALLTCQDASLACVDQPCTHGRCFDILSAPGFVCSCDAGYTGLNCSTAISTDATEPEQKNKPETAMYVLVVLLIVQTVVIVVFCIYRRQGEKTKGQVKMTDLVFPEAEDRGPRLLYSYFDYFDDDEEIPYSFSRTYDDNAFNLVDTSCVQTISGVEEGNSEA